MNRILQFLLALSMSWGIALPFSVCNNSGIDCNVTLQWIGQDGVVSGEHHVVVAADTTATVLLDAAYKAVRVTCVWVEDGIEKNLVAMLEPASYEPEKVIDNVCALFVSRPSDQDTMKVRLLGKQLAQALAAKAAIATTQAKIAQEKNQ